MKKIDIRKQFKLFGAFVMSMKVTADYEVTVALAEGVQKSQLFGLLTYMAVWIALFATYKSLWGTASFPYGWFYLAVACGYILVVVFQSVSERRIRKFWLIVWVIIFGSIILQVFGLLKLLGYGDRGELATMVMVGEVFPRWMGGSAVLVYIHRLWTIIPGLNKFSNDINSVLTVIKVFGAIVMMLISASVLIKWPNRMSVILPLTTPVYLMLSLGYDEYYPFIAGLFLIFLVNVFEMDPEKQNVYWLGFLLAILPVFYIPFLPVSMIALAYYCFFYSSMRWKLLLTFLSVCILSVFLFWPSGQGNYITSLISKINTGNMLLLFSRYRDQSASNNIFFKPQNVTTWEHFSDLFYMFLWSGNMVIGILLGAGVYYLTKIGIFKKLIISPRIPLLAALFIWQLFYFVFMLPRLGPRTDIDLFFSFYICLAFLTGYILDFIKDQTQLGHKIHDMVIPAVIANAVVTLFFLVVVGIPQIT